MQSNFQPLTLESREDYNRYLSTCPDITSDYSFVNLWAWRNIYKLEWTFDQDLVWIRQNSPSRSLWAPIGNWDSIDWQTKFGNLEQNEQEFIRIPERLYNIWNHTSGNHTDFFTDPDHWDYIYSVQELIDLKGNRFHKKKNLLKQFMRKYDYIYYPLTLDKIEKALTLQTEWCMWRDCEDSTTLESENQAILETLEDYSKLEGLISGALEVEGRMVAFAIGEALDADTVVVHFEKGCPKYKGVYQAINQQFLENSASGFTYVNREQDLGDPGLRKAKESYNPVSYQKKYSGRMILK